MYRATFKPLHPVPTPGQRPATSSVVTQSEKKVLTVAVRWLKLREGSGGGDLSEVRAELSGEGRWGSFGGTGDGYGESIADSGSG